MNTENALLFCDGCSTDPIYEQTKAYYLAQSYAASIAKGLRANIWFDVRGDWYTRLTGLIDINTHEPLPAYDAYKFASQKLGNAQYLQDITAYPGVTGYVFDLGGSLVSVIWSRDGQAHDITLPELPSKIYDVYGVESPPTIDLTVDLMPLYIETQETINQVNVALPVIYKNYQTLINGDFELGDRGWNLENQGLPAQVITASQGETIGSRSLLLGSLDYDCAGVPIDGYAQASQSFAVPYAHNSASIELRFKYVIYTQDSSFDSFEVHINDQSEPKYEDWNKSGGELSCDTWYRIPGPENERDGRTDGWATGSVDLSAYNGAFITVSFENHNTGDEYYNTYTYVDDIEIVIGE